MMICRGIAADPKHPDIVVVGLTPDTIEYLAKEQVLELASPAGLPFNLLIVFAINDDALVKFMRDNGAHNAIVEHVDQPTKES